MEYRSVRIKDVIDGINKDYFLPAIQRELVWEPAQIEKLFDSNLGDYPIGSFLFWKVEERNKEQWTTFEFIRQFDQAYPHNPEADLNRRARVGPAPCLSHEFLGLRVEDQFHPVLDVELFVDVVQVDFQRSLADGEAVRHVAGPKAAGQHADDLELPRREARRLVASGGLAAEQGIERPTGQLCLEPLLARMDLADALHEEAGRGLFQHNPPHAEAQRVEHLVLLERAREQDDLSGGLVILHLAQDIEPVLAWHVDVEDQDVGAVAADGGEGFLAVHAASAHLEVGLQLGEARQPAQHDRMVRSEEHTSELQSRLHLVCRLLLEKKKKGTL